MATDANVVDKSGSWYAYNGSRIGQGRENAKTYLKEHPETFDPKKYSAQGREEVKQYVMDKIKVCGSDGKAG